MSISINYKRIAFRFSIGIVAECVSAAVIYQLCQLTKVIVVETTSRCFRSTVYYGVGGAKVQATSMLVGVSLHITSGIRLRCEAVVVVVCLRYSSTVGVSLALLQPCVSRLK